MATQEEAIGSGTAGQALAAAAIEMLVKLGHSDLLDQIKSTALDTVNRSIDAYPGIDHEKAKDEGRLKVMALVEGAKLNAALNSSRQTGPG